MPEASLLDHPSVKRRKLDVAEYLRMGEVGILRDDEPIELIEGQMVEMAPISAPHAAANNVLNRSFVLGVKRRGVVSPRNPVQLDCHNDPRPDLALLRPRDDDYFGHRPRPDDVLLIVEIADASLRYDREVKLPLYARHKVPEVWIVDLPGRLVEVHREPEAGDRYASVTRVGPGEWLEPALLPGVVLAASDILG
jgi:Uma2 family endonuclease